VRLWQSRWARTAFLFVVALATEHCSGKSSSNVTSSPSPVSASVPAPAPITPQQQAEMVRAYLFKEGSMADTSGVLSCEPGRMWIWARDVSDVEIHISPRASQGQRDAVMATANQYTQITNGAVRFRELRDDTGNGKQRGQITVRVSDNVGQDCQGASEAACATNSLWIRPYEVGSGEVILSPTTSAAAHEMNHVLLRACHVRPGTLVSDNSVMGSNPGRPQWTDWEVETMRALFDKGARGGTTSADLVTMGAIVSSTTPSLIDAFGLGTVPRRKK